MIAQCSQNERVYNMKKWFASVNLLFNTRSQQTKTLYVAPYIVSPATTVRHGFDAPNASIVPSAAIHWISSVVSRK